MSGPGPLSSNHCWRHRKRAEARQNSLPPMKSKWNLNLIKPLHPVYRNLENNMLSYTTWMQSGIPRVLEILQNKSPWYPHHVNGEKGRVGSNRCLCSPWSSVPFTVLSLTSSGHWLLFVPKELFLWTVGGCSVRFWKVRSARKSMPAEAALNQWLNQVGE